MAGKRQEPDKAFRDPRNEAVAYAFDLPHRHRIPEHNHSRDQLVYAQTGVMTVITATGAWVVPPNRAVWVPAGVLHQLRMSGRVEMRTLYLRKGVAASLPRSCAVVAVPPLLRELVLHVVRMGALSRRRAGDRRVIDFLLDCLRELSSIPLHIRWPSDPRARRVADRVTSDPAARNTLDDYAALAGVSKRTLERLFISETNLSFRQWRQQVRLLKSQELLAAGKNVTTVALDVGYDSTSAFIAAFRRAFSATPRQYFRLQNGGREDRPGAG